MKRMLSAKFFAMIVSCISFIASCYSDEYPKLWYSIGIGGMWTYNESVVGAIVSWKVQQHYANMPGLVGISPYRGCECEIYRNGVYVATVIATGEVNYYTDTDVAAGQVCTYTVKAMGASGKSNFRSLRSVELSDISKTRIELDAVDGNDNITIKGTDYRSDMNGNLKEPQALICNWRCPEWISVKRIGETYSITADNNKTATNRSGKVCFVVGYNNFEVATVDVEQKANFMPEVSNDAAVATVVSGFEDGKVAENIKTVTDYAAYRAWAMGLSGVTSETVKASPNAWLSYALNCGSLIASMPKEGDVKIDAFESSSADGAFEFKVKVKNITVGKDALEANIRKVFDVEGCESLGNDSFSSDAVTIDAAVAEDGKVKFTVVPKKAGGKKPGSFFFRVKMK